MVQNPIRHSIIFTGHNAIGEFNEDDGSFHQYTHGVKFMEDGLSIKTAKSSFYIANEQMIIRVSLDNYEVNTIFNAENAYQIDEIYSSEIDDDLFFTAVQYSDGRRILGKVSDSNIVIYDIAGDFEVIGKL